MGRVGPSCWRRALEFTNGLDFTPDGGEICVVETTTGKVLRAALAGDGTLAEPLREFVRFEGSVGPDGIRFAASGNLYVTLFGRGQVAVVSPEGPGDRPPAGAGSVPGPTSSSRGGPCWSAKARQGPSGSWRWGRRGFLPIPRRSGRSLKRHQVLGERPGPQREIQTS